jgi:hypothetical protein
MKTVITLLLFALCLTSAQALEQPTNNPERYEYPVLTMSGLEDFQLGQAVPINSSFPGLTTKRYQEDDWEDGRTVKRSYLKMFQNGYYFGKATLDKEGRLLELEIVDWRVTYERKFAAGSTWKHVQAQLPDVKLHYGYELDALVAESPDLQGLQVHFDTEAYRVPSKLKGEFPPLLPAELTSGAKATKLRLFWVPLD